MGKADLPTGASRPKWLEGIQGRGEGFEDRDSRGDDFDADTVAGDAGDIVEVCGLRERTSL
jgi:hypothetical protein